MKNSKSKVKRKEVKGVNINISEYARNNGVSWATAKKMINNVGRKKRTTSKSSKLSEFMDIIVNKLENYACSATSIYWFIKDKGYTGSKSLVIKQVQKIKKNLLKKATLRVETTPGLQSQIDWKESLTLLSKDKTPYKVNIFLYVLSYSKFKYIELTIDRVQPTLFRCIVNAFKYCGSRVPDEIWFDNMSTVVDRHDVNTNEVFFNQKFLEFSKNAGFKPIACKPYRPCTKGLSENLAKVMDRLKVYNEEFEDYEELKQIVIKLNEDLNNEVSQATNEVCKKRFESKEKEYLNVVNLDQFNYDSNRQVRKVSNESMINYNHSKYSVPTYLINELVEIDVDEENNTLHIYYSGKEVASHTLSNNKFNYRKDDLKDILRATFRNASDEKIEEMANRRLQGLDYIDRSKR